jgi:hypothetical protein
MMAQIHGFAYTRNLGVKANFFEAKQHFPVWWFGIQFPAELEQHGLTGAQGRHIR